MTPELYVQETVCSPIGERRFLVTLTSCGIHEIVRIDKKDNKLVHESAYCNDLSNSDSENVYPCPFRKRVQSFLDSESGTEGADVLSPDSK